MSTLLATAVVVNCSLFVDATRQGHQSTDETVLQYPL